MNRRCGMGNGSAHGFFSGDGDVGCFGGVVFGAPTGAGVRSVRSGVCPALQVLDELHQGRPLFGASCSRHNGRA